MTLLLVFGSLAAFGVLPFAAWRIWRGQWLIGLIEIVLVLSFLVPLWFAWRRDRAREVSYLEVTLITAGVLVLAPMIGPVALLWSFPVMVANLLLTGRRLGLVANTALIAGLLLIPGLHANLSQQLAYVITGGLVSLFAWLFALLTDQQREKLSALLIPVLTMSYFRRKKSPL